MYRRTTTVINRTGLPARPASQFTNAAKAFDSRISIRNLSLKEQDNIANAKSIICLLYTSARNLCRCYTASPGFRWMFT